MFRSGLRMFGLSFWLQSCLSAPTQISNREALYQNCMETFQEEMKCKDLLKKSEENLKTEEEKKREKRINLSQEDKNSLKIRDEMKDLIISRNKLFVISYIGEPDKKETSADRDYWIYSRPISRYSTEHDPDDEVTVIFRRGQVERITVIKPSTTPDEGFSLRNLIKAREERKSNKP